MTVVVLDYARDERCWRCLRQDERLVGLPFDVDLEPRDVVEVQVNAGEVRARRLEVDAATVVPWRRLMRA